MKTAFCSLLGVMLAAGIVVAEDANDPAAPHAPGIYYYSEAGGQRQMTKIAPDSYSKTKSGFGFFAGYGQQTKQKAVIEGAHAELQFSEARPTFYFYIASTATGLGEEAALKPEDFVLSKMEVKKEKNERRLVVGKTGWYSGTKTGADKKSTRGFEVETISPGAYKITVGENMPSGEYCFFRPIGGSGTFFPFGIQAAGK